MSDALDILAACLRAAGVISLAVILIGLIGHAKRSNRRHEGMAWRCARLERHVKALERGERPDCASCTLHATQPPEAITETPWQQ